MTRGRRRTRVCWLRLTHALHIITNTTNLRTGFLLQFIYSCRANLHNIIEFL